MFRSSRDDVVELDEGALVAADLFLLDDYCAWFFGMLGP